MATYAFFLSGGSQIGPVIAGYLVASKGWCWFFYLCLILAAINFVTTFFLLPETLYKAETATEPEPHGDLEKVSQRHIATVSSRSTSDSFGYAAYWKGLFRVGTSQEARKEGVLKSLGYAFALPLPMILIPGVLLASIMYGVILGG
jgi:MFS family permease